MKYSDPPVHCNACWKAVCKVLWFVVVVTIVFLAVHFTTGCKQLEGVPINAGVTYSGFGASYSSKRGITVGADIDAFLKSRNKVDYDSGK